MPKIDNLNEWEYTRIETNMGQYTTTTFLEFLNNLGSYSWEVVNYDEITNRHKEKKFIVLAKRKKIK